MAEVKDATCVVNVHYSKEGPVFSKVPVQSRGQDVERPRAWVRGETPWVEYTYHPPALPTPRSPTRKELTHMRQADVRVARALRDAWCDPARARTDLLAAGATYASVGDTQGLANAFIAHAQTRLSDAHLAEHESRLNISTYALAREEYQSAHAIFTSLLHTEPARYQVRRLDRFQKASIGQRMRPYPLKHTAEDAYIASIG